MDQPTSESTFRQAENEIGRETFSGWQKLAQAQGLNSSSSGIKRISRTTLENIVRDSLLGHGQEIIEKNVEEAARRVHNTQGVTPDQEELKIFAKDLVEKTRRQAQLITQSSPYSFPDQIRKNLPIRPQLTFSSFRKSAFALLKRSTQTPAKQVLDAVAERTLPLNGNKSSPC